MKKYPVGPGGGGSVGLNQANIPELPEPQENTCESQGGETHKQDQQGSKKSPWGKRIPFGMTY